MNPFEIHRKKFEEEQFREEQFREEQFREEQFREEQFAETFFESTRFSDGVISVDPSKKSLKRYIANFSIYDAVDSAYDVLYKIPDVADYIAVGFDGFESHCDKYDYAMAAFSGVLTGFLDVFLVGNPKESVLGKVTDAFVDKVVIKFAKLVFKVDKYLNSNSQRKEPDTIASAIGYLERRFKVNYDARFPKDLIDGETLENFNPSSHHLKSLAHSPDMVGLFFSILDQFTGKTTVINNGKIIRLESQNNDFELKGNTVVSKFACGFINWFGHLMSDVSGSSGTRGHTNSRGMGIPIPGFELLQLAGRNKEKEMRWFAELTEKMFLEGYDMRYGIAMAIPVCINDLFIKLFWVIRERYQFNTDWKEIICNIKNDKRLMRMTWVSAGCFSLIDIGDAAVRSEGNLLLFALRVNYVGVCKFAFAGYREVAVRVKEVSNECVESFLEKEWESCFQP